MPAYHLTPDAQADLIEIRRYTIQEWGTNQSQSYLSELRQAISLLAESPSLGKHRTDVGTGVLSFPHGSHVIYYIKHSSHIVVFAVLHQRMLPSHHLTQRNII
ncbi:Toxin ParE1 [Vibrio aerogenes CECT 7868]|uniref:Toxin n=1 Tax=Vibrio aerogenes CECT 7868 TaxID=1216006 RepID=A0A1M6AE28_9VIBR|nr:type II toxin-antitoxin system RelE/ParE family toxin [Vibrio aerogenes]SHI34558.1 Toxin ParE1 [Vibrio aerogenes CECT 7868]